MSRGHSAGQHGCEWDRPSYDRRRGSGWCRISAVSQCGAPAAACFGLLCRSAQVERRMADLRLPVAVWRRLVDVAAGQTGLQVLTYLVPSLAHGAAIDGVRLGSRDGAAFRQRPSRVSPHCLRRRSACRRVDAARVAAQLCIAAVGQGRADRTDRSPDRTRWRVRSDRDRLPQAAPTVIEEGAVAMNELFPRADRYSPQATRSKKPGRDQRSLVRSFDKCS
jgi:hypothetical protein